MMVSIVIPAYNAQKTLERAMQSVLNQTLTDIELIVVDDGSLDSSLGIANTYAIKDSRVKVIRQVNKGCYEARIAGFAIAKGKYVTSVDADDYLEVNMIEKMVSVADYYNLDVVECDFWGQRSDKLGELEIYESKESVYRNVVKPRLVFGVGYMCVCGKMYRNVHDWSRFDHLRTTAFEDIIINSQVFPNVGRYGYIHDGLYHYEMVAGSSARRLRLDNLKGLYHAIRIRRKNGYPCLCWNLKNVFNMLKLAIRSIVK